MFDFTYTGPYPKFYYGGSKHHGIKSDFEFIVKHLRCLTESDAKKASYEYEQIYLTYTERKERREARYYANKFLQEFTKEHCKPGIHKVDSETKEKKSGKVQALIEKAKKAQREAKPKIELRSRRHG